MDSEDLFADTQEEAPNGRQHSRATTPAAGQNGHRNGHASSEADITSSIADSVAVAANGDGDDDETQIEVVVEHNGHSNGINVVVAADPEVDDGDADGDAAAADEAAVVAAQFEDEHQSENGPSAEQNGVQHNGNVVYANGGSNGHHDGHEAEQEQEHVVPEDDFEFDDDATEMMQLADDPDHEEVIGQEAEEEASADAEAEDSVAAAEAADSSTAEADDEQQQPDVAETEDADEAAGLTDAATEASTTAAHDARRTHLPLNRIKGLMKLNPRFKLASAEAMFCMTKVTEMFVENLTRESFHTTHAARKRTVQLSDLRQCIKEVDCLLFLEGSV